MEKRIKFEDWFVESYDFCFHIADFNCLVKSGDQLTIHFIGSTVNLKLENSDAVNDLFSRIVQYRKTYAAGQRAIRENRDNIIEASLATQKKALGENIEVIK